MASIGRRRWWGVVVLAAAATIAAALLLPACQRGASARTIRLRVAGSPERDSAPRCVFVIRAAVLGGGTQTTCLTDVRGVPGPNAVIRSVGTMAFALPRGRLDARVRITQRFERDGLHARQSTTGTIAGGSGAYAGAAGTLSGNGTVVDRFTGLGPVDLAYTLTLDER